jgi:signal peptidase I
MGGRWIFFMKRETRKNTIAGWLLTIGIAFVAALLIRNFVFGIIQVEGPSMQPTLYTDERLAVEKVSRYFGLPERGDVLIVKYPHEEDTYVKRAVGLPGERVEVRDCMVYIDGVPLAEDYINDQEAYADMEPFVVPEDHVFVMGDNRAHSWDSRMEGTGPIERGAILGHAVYVIYPFDRARAIH